MKFTYIYKHTCVVSSTGSIVHIYTVQDQKEERDIMRHATFCLSPFQMFEKKPHFVRLCHSRHRTFRSKRIQILSDRKDCACKFTVKY